MIYNFKDAKLFLWRGRAVNLEELKSIAKYKTMDPCERLFLREILAKFDMILGDNEMDKVRKAMNELNAEATCDSKEATITLENTINFRDWISGKDIQTGKNVLVNEKDFELLESHYNGFVAVEPKMQLRIKREQEALAATKEKNKENYRYTQAQCNDINSYAEVNLSYLQWKRVGRYVKQGEKSIMYTMDASGSKYALFSFAQTDVAKERYKSATKNCACGAPEDSIMGYYLNLNR